MTEGERRAQLTAAEGRVVRTSASAHKLIAVMEFESDQVLNRTKRKLVEQGWKFVKRSGMSILLEVRL